MLLLPANLKKGDQIGFFSPSSAATHWAPKRFARAKKFLQEKGFELVAGNLTGQNDFYRSGSIQERAAELNELIRNPSVRCIMSVIGGANSNSILPYIDYKALEKDPKIMIGYSDMTAILLAIYSQVNLVTFYGPALVASFGEMGQLVAKTFQYFSDILINPKVPMKVSNPAFWTDEKIDWETQSRTKEVQKNELITLQSGKATGRLIVGNLNTILGIYGSPYMPAIREGDLLVIEDAMKNPAIIERSFAHLKINGIFDKIGGLILGKHEKFDDLKTGRKPYEIMQEVMGEKNIPILAEYDSCHTHPMITLPIGVRAELDSDAQTLTILERSTKH